METPTFTSSVHYQDPKAALAWLERAFGFEITMAIEGPPEAPHMCHYEMSVGGRGRLMLGGQWEEWVKSPKSLGGSNTQVIHVMLEEDLDAHCERARAAGGRIVQEPAEQFFGARTYRVADLEGHRWTFSVHVRDVSRTEAEAALGQPIVAKNWL
jgi:uncharacterized glyoxalase superfamily protein PhnB